MAWIFAAAALCVCLYFGFQLFKYKRRVQFEVQKKFDEYIKEKELELNTWQAKKISSMEQEYENRVKIKNEALKLISTQIKEEDEKLVLVRAHLNDTIIDQKAIVDAEIAKYKVEKAHATDEQLMREYVQKAQGYDDNMDRLYENYHKTEAVLLEQSTSAQAELEKVKAELEEFRIKRASINEAIMREKELNEKQDFYRVCLSNDDVEDIELLKTMTGRLRHRELIPKLIWDALVSRPTTEMIKRVTGGRDVCGIYRITYLPTQEAYVGKTTDIKTRWKNHICTALGMEKAASSTLHTHMAAHGIQNYTFEILEEVSKDKLGEREKYWIQFYETHKFGLNQKVG